MPMTKEVDPRVREGGERVGVCGPLCYLTESTQLDLARSGRSRQPTVNNKDRQERLAGSSRPERASCQSFDPPLTTQISAHNFYVGLTLKAPTTQLAQ